MKVSRAILAALLFLGAISLAAKGADAADTPTAGIPQAAGVPEARYETRADCWPGLPTDKASRDRMECGVLHVPELRDGHPTRMLELAVVRIAARNPSGHPPIVDLHGGPGGSSTRKAALWLRSELSRNHDMILLDQRGGGLSKPSLCPSVFKNVPRDGRPDALQACVKVLRAAGGDPAGYTPLAIAADVDDLRRTLGLDRIAIFANSFGTVIGQILLATRPDMLSAVVLDSVVPTFGPLVGGAGQVITTFQGVLRRCAEDPGCAAAYPDLETRFLDRLDGLRAGGGTGRHPSDPEALMWALFLSLYAPDMLRATPVVLDQIASGNLGPFGLLADHLSLPAIADIAAYFAIACSVARTDENDAELARLAADHPRWAAHAPGRQFLTVCARWPERIQMPAVDGSAVPVLIVQGVDDPITPPVNGRMLAARMTDVRILEVPSQSHGAAITDRCATVIAAAFLANPAASPRVSNCGQATPVPFVTADIRPLAGLGALLGSGLLLDFTLSLLMAMPVAGTVGAGLFALRLRDKTRRAPGAAEITGVLALTLAAIFCGAVLVAALNLADAHPWLSGFGLAAWIEPWVALPWLILPLALASLLLWVGRPATAPETGWGRLGLGMTLGLSGTVGLLAIGVGAALGL